MVGHIKIVEVGPRDGLQNEKTVLPTSVKVEYVSRAIAAGLRRIEVAGRAPDSVVEQVNMKLRALLAG